MKIKFYSVVVSAFLLISFSSFADTDLKSVNTEKIGKSKNQSVAGKKSSEYVSAKSSVYTRDGLVKRKGSKKSCPAFIL
jgi:hypothetical protein